MNIKTTFTASLRRALNAAPAFGTAAVLCRFRNARLTIKSGSGLPQSKTLWDLGGFSIFLAMFLSMVLLASCSKPAGDKPADAPEKTEAPAKAGVTIDAATQARIGLKTESPVATAWQPQLRAAGRVVDPLVFSAAAADYDAVRAAVVATGSELERTQKLVEQNNSSARALETAQAAATRDLLAFKSAQAKFASDWGGQLAARTNLATFVETLQTGESALVKLSLPVGEFPNPLPTSASLCLFNDETSFMQADFADNLGIDPATQVQMLLFSVNKKLPPGAAVAGFLKTSGEPVGGVAVPFSAVVRHEGKGWIYVQTETNQFVRTEIPLDRLMNDGWFVSENLSATNHIVVTGAQTVLSAELSGGEFNTGTRD